MEIYSKGDNGEQEIANHNSEGGRTERGKALPWVKYESTDMPIRPIGTEAIGVFGHDARLCLLVNSGTRQLCRVTEALGARVAARLPAWRLLGTSGIYATQHSPRAEKNVFVFTVAAQTLGSVGKNTSGLASRSRVKPASL